jgi:dTDP-4-amino-4,6-dideoxygalactose transaminase
MALKYPFLDLKPVNAPFEEALMKAACDVIASGRYINGEYVSRLEKEIASMCDTPYAVAVSNGLDALKLIIRAYKEMGVFTEGDEIIMSANTYIATALAVSDEGLKPVFVDISASTLNLDTSLIEKAITLRTKAIMPVHLYGTPCWDNTLKDVAHNYGLKIIEDNAQAIGANTNIKGLYGTHRTGGLGDAAGTSFYPTKNLGALGDAGIVTTHDSALADTVRALANYGCDRRYHNIYKGFNCRMDEIQAAMLLVKLPHLDDENNRRRNIVNIYNTLIDNESITKPHIFNDSYQVWHQYPLRVVNRDAFISFMQDNGVGTDIMYPSPVYLQPCYHDYAGDSCPEAENFAKEVICLPIGAHISENSAAEIAQVVNLFNK